MTCMATGCNRKAFDGGFCSYHYLRTFGGASGTTAHLMAPAGSVFNLAARGQATQGPSETPNPKRNPE
jgi:hypothetical protein